MVSFRRSLVRGLVSPFGPNPPTHISASSTTNLGTRNISVLKINQKAFGGHNMALFKTSLAKGTVPVSHTTNNINCFGPFFSRITKICPNKH